MRYIGDPRPLSSIIPTFNNFCPAIYLRGGSSGLVNLADLVVDPGLRKVRVRAGLSVGLEDLVRCAFCSFPARL
jgi:hypothetical protein